MHAHNMKPKNINHAEQFCIKCDRWFTFSDADLKALNEKWALTQKPGVMGIPFTQVACKHCTTKQVMVMPGKYDRPNARKAKCEVQYLEFGQEALQEHQQQTGLDYLLSLPVPDSVLKMHRDTAALAARLRSGDFDHILHRKDVIKHLGQRGGSDTKGVMTRDHTKKNAIAYSVDHRTGDVTFRSYDRFKPVFVVYRETRNGAHIEFN